MAAGNPSRWRSAVAAASAFILAAVGLAAGAAPASAVDTYTVSGVVTHDEVAGPDPLTIAVVVSSDTNGYWAWHNAAADGSFTFSDLAAGEYDITIQPQSYYDAEAGFRREPNLLAYNGTFAVDGGDITGLDFHLDEGLTLSGRVDLGEGADPSWVKGVTVYAQNYDAGFGTYAYVEASGDYTLAGLMPGDYLISFSARDYWDDGLGENVDVNLVNEYWDDALTEDHASLIAVGAESVTGIDVELAVGRVVSGTVALPEGAPAEWAEGIWIEVCSTSGARCYSSTLNDDLTYRVDSMPGSEVTVALDPNGYWDESDEWVRPNVAPQWYPGATSPSAAATVDLAAGDATGIDFALEYGRTLSGNVSLEAGADPAELENGVYAYAESADGSGDGWAWSQVDPETGDYAIVGLAPGEYVVLFEGSRSYDSGLDAWVESALVREYWDDALSWDGADVVDVTLADATGIDAELAVGTTISGTVTLPAGYDVEVFEAIDVVAEGAEFSGTAHVAPDGTYTVRGLPDDAYTVEFPVRSYWDDDLAMEVTPNLVPQFYDGVHTPFAATAVDVSTGAQTGVDATLVEGRSISGTVSIGDSTDAWWLGMASVSAYTPELWEAGYAEVDEATGEYTISRLPDGDFTVCVDPGGYWDEGLDDWVASPLAGECYDDVAWGDAANPVTVDGADVAGIDFELLELVPEEPAVIFTDISDDTSSPFYSAFFTEISWFAAQGITTGYPNGDGTAEYRPFGNVTRDAMAAFLYRYAGSPEYDAPEVSPFTDVSPSKPFYTEICWLAETGITTGWDIGGGKKEFRPYESITRDAMAAFLYRFAGEPEWEAPGVSPFADVAVGKGFYDEITWLADSGITTGWTVGGKKEFRPFASITRDAMAAFLYRFSALTGP